MRGSFSGSPGGWRIGAVTAALLAACTARADTLSLRLQGDYAATQATTVDASGVRTSSRGQSLTDTYRLSLAKPLYESVSLSADGYLQELRNWTESGATRSDSTTRNWAGSARLTFGGELLSGGLSYDRRQGSSSSSVSTDAFLTGTAPTILASSTPTLVDESLSGILNWRPMDLPPLSLRLTHSDQYDLARTVRDTTSSSVVLQSAFGDGKPVEGSLLVGYTKEDDHLHDSGTAASNAQLAVRYASTLGGHGNLYLNEAAVASLSETSSHGRGGTVATQQFASAGLALVEAIADTPLQSTLKPAPALVDGNVGTGAGISLGTSAAARGDIARRDLGLQLPDVLRPVNTVYVWVTQPLPPEISSQFTWTVYESDDNVTWRPVPLVGPAVFGVFEARFELTIQITRARFLKVVTTPLPLGATTDPRFGDIQVTEVQAFDIVPAELVRGRSTAWTNSLSGGLSLPLTPDRQLAYDLSFTLSIQGPKVAGAWLVSNGLGWNTPLSPSLTAAARLQRSDTGGSGGGQHTGQTSWGASLGAQPLPTLTANASYNGAMTDGASGATFTNNLTGLVTANVYEGVSATATAGTGIGSSAGRISRTAQTTLSTTVIPARFVNFTTGYAIAFTSTDSGAGTSAANRYSENFSASANLTPVPALSTSGTFSHVRQTGTAPISLAGFQISYSPFSGGNLLLSLTHSESFESQNDVISRLSGASVEWRATPWAKVSSGYTVSDTSAPLGRSDVRSFLARLVLSP